MSGRKLFEQQAKTAQILSRTCKETRQLNGTAHRHKAYRGSKQRKLQKHRGKYVFIVFSFGFLYDFSQGKDFQKYPANFLNPHTNPSLVDFLCSDPRKGWLQDSEIRTDSWLITNSGVNITNVRPGGRPQREVASSAKRLGSPQTARTIKEQR